MLLTGSKSIRDVILFPLMRKEQGSGIRDQGSEGERQRQQEAMRKQIESAEPEVEGPPLGER